MSEVPLQGFEFEDPVEMLLMLDDALLDGTSTLHGWQMKVLKDFAKPTVQDLPYQAVLRTCNGAGKDSKIIAPCAKWLCDRYVRATSVITSASSTQLDRQTAPRLTQLCESMNSKFGREVWKINYRHYENLETRSTIEMFVTDEAGRAEGWHPVLDGGQLAILTSEAKSIPEEIFHALARCTGFTKRLDCSTPGLPIGHFFSRCTGSGWLKYHITAYDCPHLSRSYIEQCKIDYGGENSALFKSMVMAEFATTDDLVVISYYRVHNAIFNQLMPHIVEKHNDAGLDLAAGGDENGLVIRNGNKVIKVYGFRLDDTAVTVRHLEKLFKDNQLDNPESRIYGDAGGLGKPILDQLKDRGWKNIRFVLNQGEPRNKKVYWNRGAENWFFLNKLMEGNEVLLPNDELLKKQLATRHYKIAPDGRVRLESKLEARSKGRPSPDRADACVLAFCNYKTKLDENKDFDSRKLPYTPKKVDELIVENFSLREHAKRMASPDPYEQYYGTLERRPNINELRREIAEYNLGRKKGNL